MQLRNDGNYEGEGSSTPGSTVFSNSPSIIGNYPEAFNASRNYPDGRLQAFQRHRMRIWSVYNLGMGPAGDMSFSGLWRVESGLAYSLAARNQALSSTQVALLTAAGYPEAANLAALGPITGNAVFFDDRGSETFKGYGLARHVDQLQHPGVPHAEAVGEVRRLQPVQQPEAHRLEHDHQAGHDNAEDSLGLRTGYVPTTPATFGTATGNTVSNLFSSAINAYPLAYSQAPAGGRTFRVAIGFRF